MRPIIRSCSVGLKEIRDQREWKRFAADNKAGLIIVEFSGNDASPIHGMPLSASRKTHNAIVELAHKNGAVVTLATMSPGWNMNALERPGQDRYHAIYRDLAGSQIGLIDTIEVWRSISSDERPVWVPDNLHPTDQAMIKFAVPHFREHIMALYCPHLA